MLEADLYAPVKAHLEAAGYTVRGEVGHCDILAFDGETLLAVELKRGFGLPVLYQALRRCMAVDLAYVAVGVPEGRKARQGWDANLSETTRLCRMLGLGLLSVRNGRVVVDADPGPFQPRQFKSRRGRLLGEFQRRSGDHNIGGTTRQPRMTAYREDALRCARVLAEAGVMRPAALRDASGVAKVALMLRRNVYGWFEKRAPAQYGLTAAGHAALGQHADVIAAQAAAGSIAGSSAPPRRKARAPKARLPTPENPGGTSLPAPAS